MKNLNNHKLALLALSILIVFVVPNVGTSSTIETAQTTVVRIIPSPITVQLGSAFTVACVIENVTDLSGLDIQIAWNTTMLTYVNHTATMTVENYPAPIPPSPYAGIIHDPPLPVKNDVNTTTGTYWVAFFTLGGPSFNGSGTAFVMTFMAAKEGVMKIRFTSSDLGAVPGPIAHNSIDGVVNIDGAPQIHSVQRTPTLPNYDEEVTITANITDVSLDQVILSYTCDFEWRNTSMSEFSGLYNASIPRQPYNTTVEYKVYANDTDEYWSESNTHSYLVGDSTPPNIGEITWTPTSPPPLTPSNQTRAGEPVQVTVSILEPVNASGGDEALLSYRVDEGAWWNTTMMFNETNGLWTCAIPGQLQNSNVEFFVEVKDLAGNSNTSSTIVYDVSASLIGDIDGDGDVDIFDIVMTAYNYGKSIP